MRCMTLAIIGGAVAFGLVTGVAKATPPIGAANAIKSATPTSNMILQVDGCNRYCKRGEVPEWGGVVRWHRHVGQFCKPIACIP
jgi:hypothetical protein